VIGLVRSGEQAIIYLRTSTEEQDPENQLSDCQQFADRKGYDVVDTYVEHGSAWKDVEREKYQEVTRRVRKEDIDAVIVWAFDRWIRNRKQLKEDIEYLRGLGVNLHSVQENWVESINIDGPMGEAISEFVINLLGALAERESNRKSQRIKASYQNHDGPWGRPGLPDSVVDMVIEAYEEGLSYREIRDEVTYWDDNRNEQKISLGKISDIVNEYKEMSDGCSENMGRNKEGIGS